MGADASIAIVSGAAGMTGGELSAQLLERGWSVFGFDNFFAGSRGAVEALRRHRAFSFEELDLTDSAHRERVVRTARALGSGGTLHFVNCAAVVHTRHFYAPSSTFDTNVWGMRGFLEAAIASGARSFVNCSTSEVYSLRSFAEGGVRESDPLLVAGADQSLRASYAVGKLLTEFLTREAVEQGRIRGCSIRFANVYSDEELQPEHIIPYSIDALMRGGSVTLLENARTTRRTFLNNRDSASAVAALLERPEAMDGGSYNVGTDEEIGIVELVGRLGVLMGVKPRIAFSGVRTADPPRRLLNTEKLRSLTGWAPAVCLGEGLERCVAAARRRAGEGRAA